MAQFPGGNITGNANNVFYPYTGVSSYPVAPSPFGTNTGSYGTNYTQTNPNYYNGGTGMQGGTTTIYGGSPQITQGLESGWHVDNNGRFFYQGNGVVLKGTWYLIDGNFYRFSENGYALANQWFKDNATGYWYYLNGEGKMLTGWQQINGVWYYFKATNGNGYGAMYANTSVEITDAKYGTGIYAFDANGACIMNAWYGGYYYSSDGKRAK